MNKTTLALGIALIISLFIYLFYRTENTVVNQLLIAFIFNEKYMQLKTAITSLLPLNNYIVYSLPEGLWVFCITVTSQNFYLRLFQQKIPCTYFPILFAIGLELCQLMHITNGRFDFIDILSSCIGWAMANALFKTNDSYQNVFENIDYRNIRCMASYAIVYLAHVMS